MVDTTAEAQTVARRDDVVIAGSTYAPFLAAMYAAHPGVLVARYTAPLAVKRAEYRWVSAHHPSWLLRGTSGQLSTNSLGYHLVNPADPAVQRWRAGQAATSVASGWNLVYLDNLGYYNLTSFKPTPVDPATGKVYTPRAWITATAALESTVAGGVSAPVVANGLRDGTTYFGTAGHPGTQILRDAGAGAVFEYCFRPATLPIGQWPDAASWQQQLAALIDAQLGGHLALCASKLYVQATAAQLASWHTFTLASFLLGNEGTALYHFTALGDDGLTDRGEQAMPLGTPVDEYAPAGVAYVRHFTNGVVVVNPDVTSQNVQLGGTYFDPSGKPVTSVVAAPHTGTILFAS